MLSKNSVRKSTIFGDKQLQKKEKTNVAILNSTHQAKKCSSNLTVDGLNDNRAVNIVSSKFSESKTFVRRLNKVQGKYIQEQQPN